MIIEFDIDEKDLAVLVNALEFAASRVSDEHSFSTIQKVISEIKEDVKNGVAIFIRLRDELKKYTDGSTILETSNFRTQLGISAVFIKSDKGLIAVMNYILTDFVLKLKPNAKPDYIEKEKIDDAKTIKDIVNLICNNYESSN
jgi:hypothetical protein